jgi:hypothetical protein
MQLGRKQRAAPGSASAFGGAGNVRPAPRLAARSGSRRVTVAAAGGGDKVVCVGEALFGECCSRLACIGS